MTAANRFHLLEFNLLPTLTVLQNVTLLALASTLLSTLFALRHRPVEAAVAP